MNSFKQWFMRNFVTMSEVIGYIIAVAVIGGTIASAFFELDVVQSMEGEVAPVSIEIRTATPAVVNRFMSETSVQVKTDDVLCELVTSEEDINQLLARRMLMEAHKRLGATDLGAQWREQLKNMLDEILSPQSLEQVTAPAPGLFVPVNDMILTRELEADAVLGKILLTDEISIKGTTTGGKSSQIQVGQVVRFKENKTIFTGTVESVEVDGKNYSVTVIFETLPEALTQKAIAAARSNAEDVEVPTQSIGIIVDRISYFKKLFGKN